MGANISVVNPGSHKEVKEILACFTDAAVDRMVETCGMDEFDKVKVRKSAQKQGEQALSQNYNPEWDSQ